MNSLLATYSKYFYISGTSLNSASDRLNTREYLMRTAEPPAEHNLIPLTSMVFAAALPSQELDGKPPISQFASSTGIDIMGDAEGLSAI